VPSNATDPAIQCLDKVAAEASSRLQQTVTRIAPRDGALTWKAASVHPLQALETEYQGIVHDAVRGITNPDTRKTVESQALGNFFFFDGGTPRLLGVGQGQPYNGAQFPFLEDRLREARIQLKAAEQLMTPPPNQQIDGVELREYLMASYNAAVAVRDAFYALPGSANWPVPAIDEASQQLAGVGQAIQSTHLIRDFEVIIQHLRKAIAALEVALIGLCSAQMFYVIEPFYLFRLLVRYRIESERALSNEAVAEASATLTDLVTNGHAWLSAWLRDKIVELAARIAAVDPSGNTLFFLKGGRAIRYLEGNPDGGKNDWDTQIVINPELPAAAWYALFLRVSNEVLLALKDFKTEFYMLLHHHANDFMNELAAVAIGMDVEDPPVEMEYDEVFDRMEIDDLDDRMEIDDPPDDVPAANKANCKAELIDVGLPRYDTVEAREQWEELRNNILVYADGIPYPGYLYYIGEYVQMIRQVFAGLSPSLRKAPARIERLYGILMLPEVGPVIQQEYEAIPPELLPQSLALVAQIADIPTRYVYVVLLRQFAEAYALAKDPGPAQTDPGLQVAPGLAQVFDASFAAELPNAHERAAYSPALQQAITASATWTAGCGLLADAIGFCQWVSRGMETHFIARATFMTDQQAVLGTFLRTLYGNAIFSPTEELEVQMAINGSFAARLQAQYTQSPRIADLDPVTYLSIGLYSPKEDADPETILELVQPVVEQYLLANPGIFTMFVDTTAYAIRLYWQIEQAITPFTYRPLAAEIAVQPPPGRPLLSYIWGLPLLGLRDLILEYRGEAAEIEEFGRRTRLLETGAALTEIMTRAANPEPPNPAVVAIRRGTGHHLMISSANHAIGHDAGYPQSYYPDMAFQVVLTPNRVALHNALTMAAAATLDRSLDLLAINQGHGEMGEFADWNEDDLKTYMVAPLFAAGIRANNIVLDFCLSSSLIEAFAPLCAPDGIIISAIYTISEVIVTTDFWTTVQPALQQRNLGALQQALTDRARTVSAEVTGHAQLRPVRSASEAQIAQHLRAFPNDRDAISITRYLLRIARTLEDANMNLGLVYAQLSAVQALANLGFVEQQILANLPPHESQFTAATRSTIEAQFKNRLIQILTQPQYGLQLNVAGKPPFGDGSLWELVKNHQYWLLALAAGLTRCPTPLTRFDGTGRQLTLDAALSGPVIAQDVQDLINEVYAGSPAEVQQILNQLLGNQTVSILNQIVNYLQ